MFYVNEWLLQLEIPSRCLQGCDQDFITHQLGFTWDLQCVVFPVQVALHLQTRTEPLETCRANINADQFACKNLINWVYIKLILL